MKIYVEDLDQLAQRIQEDNVRHLRLRQDHHPITARLSRHATYADDNSRAFIRLVRR